MGISRKQIIKIENREHLLSTLAEASELEHNLMCLYLYAVFSLKQSTTEGVTELELEHIQKWRKAIMEVSIQEMSHLALVANLTTAIGGSAHFYRPAFPVKPGYFPSDFVVELAPFNMTTLDHFIFLERPEDEKIEESEDFKPEQEYVRSAPHGRLMAHSGDYETVGQLYEAIEYGIEYLSRELGESKLFCGSLALQLAPPELELEGLTLINDKASALTAIQTIVEQGEGARNQTGSHFEKFQNIKKEYEELLKKNPEFTPNRPSARNPVMRKPVQNAGTVWVNHPTSSLFLDLGNALYSLMLRFLTQVYSVEQRTPEAKKTLLEGAFSLMHSIGVAGSLISKLPATLENSGPNAGLSFALNRHFNPLELSSEKRVLSERLQQLLETIVHLKKISQTEDSSEALQKIESALVKLRSSVSESDLAEGL
jgi:hypothetical protein